MSECQPLEPKGAGEVVLYATEDGQAQVFLPAEGCNVWLSRAGRLVPDHQGEA